MFMLPYQVQTAARAGVRVTEGEQCAWTQQFRVAQGAKQELADNFMQESIWIRLALSLCGPFSSGLNDFNLGKDRLDMQ
jgi:hypothetical protein